MFEDTDGSFRRGPGSKGVPGVLVANGHNVGKTNPAGCWSLPVQPGGAVFVIKPSGWMTAVDPATYLHLPDAERVNDIGLLAILDD